MTARRLAPLPCALLLLASAAAPLPAQEAGDAARALYARANAALAETRLEEAAGLYRRVFAEHPESEVADDALFRYAETLDRRLQRYEDAFDAYRTLSERYPNSSLALRTRARMVYLEENLRTGAEPLRLFEDVLSNYHAREPRESIALMERVVRDYPGFTRAVDAMLWLGDEHARLPGGAETARGWFERVRAGRPRSEVWARATFGLAGVEKDAHHYEAARALYREVEAAAPSAETAKAAREYAAIMDKHIARRGALYGFAALMFAAAIVLATRIPWTRLGAEDLRSPRAELLLAGPLLAILVALAWGELPYVRWSVVLIALSALAALVLNALYLRTNPPKGALAVAYPFLAAAVVFGAIYAIFYAQDLVFVIEDTIKYGWD